MHPLIVKLAKELGIDENAVRRKHTRAAGLADSVWEAALAPEPVDLLQAHVQKTAARDTRADLREALERLAETQARLDFAVRLRTAARDVPTVARREASGLREGTAVVLCSDWHVEERVDAIRVNGRNEYAPEIARTRVRDRLAPAIVRLIESHRSLLQIRDLVLWLGGDLITGYIHEELLESNFLSPVEAALFVQDLCSYLIRYVLEHGKLDRVIVPCSYGNHGRLTPKPRISTGAQNSLEWYIYHQLQREFAGDPRVEFVVADGECLYLQLYDFTLRFTHGDAVKYGGGIGGVHIPLRKAIAGWDTDIRADVTCFGHFHQYIPHPRYVGNGSLIGWSPYGVRIKADLEVARQAFFVIDSKEGPCLHTPIWVQKRNEGAVVIHGRKKV